VEFVIKFFVQRQAFVVRVMNLRVLYRQELYCTVDICWCQVITTALYILNGSQLSAPYAGCFRPEKEPPGTHLVGGRSGCGGEQMKSLLLRGF
jgi:hypothetical protein